jgi:hypothetical protein
MSFSAGAGVREILLPLRENWGPQAVFRISKTPLQKYWQAFVVVMGLTGHNFWQQHQRRQLHAGKT